MTKKEQETKGDNEAKKVRDKWEEIYQNEGYVGPFNNSFVDPMISEGMLYREQNACYKWSKLISQFIMQGLNNPKRLKILDAGCGDGHDLRKMIELGAFPKKCYGVDFNPDILGKAKYLSPADVNYSSQPLDNMDFPDNTFNLIFLFNTLTNYEDDDYIRKMNDEFCRVLQTDGILFLICAMTPEGGVTKGVADLSARTFNLEQLKALFPSFEFEAQTNISLINMPIKHGYGLSYPNGVRMELNLEPLIQAVEQLKENQLNLDFIMSHVGTMNLLGSMGIGQTEYRLLTLKPN